MTGILADNDSEGHVVVLITILRSGAWREIWEELELSVASLDALGISSDAPDAFIWKACQREKLVLISANRNKDGPDSLESTIQNENQPDSLPVITLGDPQRIMRDRLYADIVATRLLEQLIAIEDFLGAGVRTRVEPTRRRGRPISLGRDDGLGDFLASEAENDRGTQRFQAAAD